jgi:hypothetical protein
VQIGQREQEEHPIEKKDDGESSAYSLFVYKLAQSFRAIGYHVKSTSEFSNILEKQKNQ